jgi:hypothetical protein
LEFRQKAENAAVDLQAGALEPWSLGALEPWGGARFSKLDVRLDDWAFCILDFQTIQASQLARSQLLGESQPEKLKRIKANPHFQLSTSCLLSAEVGCNEEAKSELTKCLR